MENEINEIQKQICHKYNSKYQPLQENELIGVALDTIGKMPISGMRYVTHGDENISWYIYCGEYSNENDFFKPIHVTHIIDILPIVMPYLSLEQGYGFVIDNQGYEDVWFGDFK